MLGRLGGRRIIQQQPLFQTQIRCVQGHPRRVLLEDNAVNPPTSEKAQFPNEFTHVRDVKEFQEIDKNAIHSPAVHDPVDFKETIGDPHQTWGFGEWHQQHYDWIREPVFPKKPDLSKGELAAGANVTRTDVWNDKSEPAITSIAKFSPYNFRPAGYAENNMPVETTFPTGLDFRHNRLPIGHADRRPALAFIGAATGFIGLSIIRGAVIKAVHCLWPSRDVFAAGVIEVDLRPIRMGQNFSAKWRGKPVFVRRRTPQMIALAKKDDVIVASMRDPATDAQRTKKPEWLICIGVCTHLGCIPFPDQGDFGGYFCPCHGSHYDHAGRLRKGPAPLNLELPPYQFLDDFTIKVG